MKIVAIRVRPVAIVLAAIYAILGFGFWLVYVFGNAPSFTLPVGIIAPLLHLYVNLTLPRSSAVLPNALLLLASIAAYAITGWVTAWAGVTIFNMFAKWKGGIRADFMSLEEDRQQLPHE